jgi:tetratricopeptide (TPR) repeat protein
MRRKTPRTLLVFAGLMAVAFGASAQPGGSAGDQDWDPTTRSLSRLLQANPATPPNSPLEALNRILSASQLSAIDRSVYLSMRAFQLSKLGRDADSQKDVVEMGRLLPNAWQVVLSSTQPELAGGGDRAAALRTLDYALQRKPGDSWLETAQAQVHMQIADFPRALGLLDGAVEGAKGGADRRSALYFRGHANFNLGNYQQAADDFEAALQGRTDLAARLAPLLWRYAAQVHTRHEARTSLARDVGNENLNQWPGQIAKFLIGRLPAGELEVVAESDEGAKHSNGKCPSAFFLGMEAQRRGDKQRAREEFQLAQARCPTVSELNWAASSELKRL